MKRIVTCLLVVCIAGMSSSCTFYANYSYEDEDYKFLQKGSGIGVNNGVYTPSSSVYEDVTLSDEDTSLADAETSQADTQALDSVSVYIDEIYDRFGIAVKVGESVPTVFLDYVAEINTNTDDILHALEVLEDTFSLYPDDFFRQMCDGEYYDAIIVYLAGNLYPKDSTTHISDASGFTIDDYSGISKVVFNINDGLYMEPNLVVHEFTHVIDYYFIGTGYWNEEAWNVLNPSGFSYAESYSGFTSIDTDYTSFSDEFINGINDNVYFYSQYGKTFSLEDRATLMEALLGYSVYNPDNYDRVFECKHVIAKLDYYFDFIREVFDDSSWGEMTSWEKELEKYR